MERSVDGCNHLDIRGFLAGIEYRSLVGVSRYGWRVITSSPLVGVGVGSMGANDKIQFRGETVKKAAQVVD